MYAFLGTSCRDAIVVFTVDDLEKTLNLIEKSNIKVALPEDF